ncbi:hypothetical protein ACCO45_011085 [Purpureocillium lilacinum]|uniref:Uncharacterized protein n=1 Tax=Purpureocillium lilacinum TaxID=33203 RepID=A0ACC4DGN6_PURLI
MSPFNLETCARPNIPSPAAVPLRETTTKTTAQTSSSTPTKTPTAPPSPQRMPPPPPPRPRRPPSRASASTPRPAPLPGPSPARPQAAALRPAQHARPHPRAITPDNLFVGVGSDEAIDALLRCFCVPGRDRILTCPPTSRTSAPRQPHGLAARQGRRRADPRPPDVERRRRPRRGLRRLRPEAASLAELVAEHPNLVVMQTLSKAFGMAGIRLGAAFASAPVARLLNSLKAPYNISSPTSALAAYALGPDGLAVMRANRARIVAQRDRLLRELPLIPGVGRLRGGTESNFALRDARRRGPARQRHCPRRVRAPGRDKGRRGALPRQGARLHRLLADNGRHRGRGDAAARVAAEAAGRGKGRWAGR